MSLSDNSILANEALWVFSTLGGAAKRGFLEDGGLDIGDDGAKLTVSASAKKNNNQRNEIIIMHITHLQIPALGRSVVETVRAAAAAASHRRFGLLKRRCCVYTTKKSKIVI
jgi:hypothetical protein